MKRNVFFLSASIACLASTAWIPAQSSKARSLLFTTLNREFTRSVAPPLSLERIIPEDVMMVTPRGGTAYTSEKFAPHKAWITLLGDEDNDARYWESVLAHKIDAVHTRRYASNTGPDMRDTYISPAIAIDGCVSASGGIKPGDVARVAPGGQVKYFLKEGQVRSAFGIPVPVPINVDAVTFDGKRVFLSFERDQKVLIKINNTLTWTYVRDGAIVMIPTAGFGEPVLGVAPNSGVIVAREVEVDKMVDNSLVRDRLGSHPTAIRDLDGLAMSPKGGYFKTMTGAWPNMFFCGETLTGGGVLSTHYFGSWFGMVASLNGMPLANTVGSTTGVQVGLRPYANTAPYSLNGLRIAHPICHFVLDTLYPVLFGGSGTLSVDIGGADPGMAWVLIGVPPALPPCAAAASIPFANSCFPDLYPFFIGVPVPINAQGYGSWNLAVTYSTGGALLFQGLTYSSNSGFKLSTPMTIEAL